MGFTLVPDRFGNTGDKSAVSADSHGNIVINLDINPIFVVKLVEKQSG